MTFNSILSKRDQILRSAFVISCVLVVLALPFSIRATSKAILILVVVWVFHAGITRLLRSLTNKWVLMFIFPYLLLLGSLIYTSDIKSGLWELEKAVPLLLFPVLFYSTPSMRISEIQCILRAFLCSNLFFGIIVLSYSTYKYLTEHVNLFYSFDLVNIFHSHPTYYSMYVLFSIASLFYLNKEGKDKSFIETASIAIFLIVAFFSILIFLLSVRSIFIIYIFSCLFLICMYAINTRKVKTGLFLFIGFLVTLCVVLSLNDVLRERFLQIKESYTYELSPDHTEGYNGFTTRLAQWECSLPIIKENFLLGVGPADVQNQLQIAYKQNYLKYSYRDKLNAHNQYVQTSLGLGMIGLISFLATLILPAILAFRERNYLILAFLALFSICCVTESMLYVHKGIVFFAFFNSLFTFQILMNQSSKKSGN